MEIAFLLIGFAVITSLYWIGSVFAERARQSDYERRPMADRRARVSE